MKLAQKLAFAGISGLVLGVSAIEMLHAEGAAPPTYLVADVKVTDPTASRAYVAKLPATLAPFGGQTLARNGTLDVLEGDRLAGGLVIIRFDSLEKARAFWSSGAPGLAGDRADPPEIVAGADRHRRGTGAVALSVSFTSGPGDR